MIVSAAPTMMRPRANTPGTHREVPAWLALRAAALTIVQLRRLGELVVSGPPPALQPQCVSIQSSAPRHSEPRWRSEKKP